VKTRARPEYPCDAEFGALAADHPAALLFRQVPRLTHAYVGIVLAYLLSMLATTPVLWVALKIVPTVEPKPLRIGILMGVAAAGIVSIRWCSLHMARRASRVGESADRAALNESRNDVFYVGVAYADGIWVLGDDFDWDRGFATFTADGLTFRGHASSFALPASGIQAVRLAASPDGGIRRIPRVFIDWAAPNGESGTLSLDARTDFVLADATRANVALADRIRHALSHPAERPLRAEWPPFVSPRRLEGAFSKRKITRADRIVGALVGLACAVTVVIPLSRAASIFDLNIGPLLVGVALLMFILWREYVLTRRIAKRAANADPVADVPNLSSLNHGEVGESRRTRIGSR
jgi:uncharacterized membrane protein